MPDQENIKPDEETDVEAPSKPPVKLANEDDFELHASKPPVKLANEDDVELHKKPPVKLASDEGKKDDDDDDVELHKARQAVAVGQVRARPGAGAVGRPGSLFVRDALERHEERERIVAPAFGERVEPRRQPGDDRERLLVSFDRAAGASALLQQVERDRGLIRERPSRSISARLKRELLRSSTCRTPSASSRCRSGTAISPLGDVARRLRHVAREARVAADVVEHERLPGGGSPSPRSPCPAGCAGR